MKTYLATANVGEIRWAAGNGLCDGVLTTPGLLHEERVAGDGHERLAEIARETGLPILATVGSVRGDDIHRDGRALARISDQVVVQVPFVEDAVVAMRKLSSEGIRVAATLVFNAAQAVLAAKSGASTVSVHVDQLDAQGHEGVEEVREIRMVFDRHGIECDVLAAFPRNASQFTGCALAGADAQALSPATLRALLLHPLTDRGIDQLLTDLSRRRPRARR